MATKHRRGWRLLLLVAMIGAIVVGLAPGEASGSRSWNTFDRWDPATPSPTGQSVVRECNPAGAGDPETWPEAIARFRLKERSGRSELTFDIRNAKPDTLYTVWLRLAGVDSEGNTYGGSPLTGLPVTPLVASSDLPTQLAFTLPHPGSDELPNGVRTNRHGKAKLTFSVDFPINSGAYPFQRFPDFTTHKDDAALTNEMNLARLGGQAASIKPVAIPDGSQAPATILIASHCVDGLGHGLIPGPHENWFVWSL